MDKIPEYVSLLSNVFTIIASGLAIYIFLAKKKTILSVFKLLMNYGYQLSLSELKEKLEKLNDYHAKDPEQSEQIVNVLNEIIGQMRGNDRLRKHFSESLSELEYLVSDRRRLTEPRKRALVSELRERLRHVNISNIDDLVGE